MVPASELPRVVVDEVSRIGVATTAMLPSHARRRGVVLAVYGRGPAPPWCPDREQVDGIVDALVAAGVPTRWTALGRTRENVGALRRIAPCTADPRTLALDHLVLSRAWIGRHLVLVVPTVLDDGPESDRRGPVASAVAAIAAAAGAGSLADDLALGAEVLAQVFAGFTIVVDAKHALLRPRRAGRRPHRLEVGRVLVTGRTGASIAECRDLIARLDAWLVARTAGGEVGDAIVLDGPCARDPWPAGAAEPIGAFGPLWPAHPRPRDARPA